MVEFTLSEKARYDLIQVRGALTMREAKSAWEYLSPLCQRQKPLAIDFSGLTDIDTMGFQLLLYLKAIAQARNFRLVYIKHSEALLDVLDLLGAAAQFGDKILLSAKQRAHFPFRYGAKKTGNEHSRPV